MIFGIHTLVPDNNAGTILFVPRFSVQIDENESSEELARLPEDFTGMLPNTSNTSAKIFPEVHLPRW
ncbi:MAG: hypothetical protein R2877_06190 [Bdellovibrionota bacterium]